MANPEITTILEMIDQAFDRRSWHGTNLKGSIKGMQAKDAAWRPAPGRHNIWELVVHAAYWKYIVRRRLLSEAKGSFALKGSNWIERPISGYATEEAWKADVRLLIATHKSLREGVAALSPAELHKTPPDSKVSNFEMVVGIAAHDLYHAGQIQLIKRLRP
ncbi:MAG TPA: DinB family protein [Pyrinomonadaceae bacterium]|nr:DinB family protein [Pyrinomonadaceae bacterium]